MSSECRCHTDTNFCFYCEMYSPLERKYEEQTAAIKRVIAEMEYGEEYYRSIDGSRASGMKHAYRVAIYKLKEVLAQHGTDDGSGVSGNVGEEAEQIPCKKNSG